MLMRFETYPEFDRLRGQGAAQGALSAIPMDAYSDGDQLIVNLDVPGVDPGALEVTVERNVLTVSARRTWKHDHGQEIVVAERPQGSFSRQLFLGEHLDPDRVQAHYDQGVLTIAVPVAQHAKPRKVEVNTDSDDATLASDGVPWDQSAASQTGTG